jgi:HEAT repeat protein
MRTWIALIAFVALATAVRAGDEPAYDGKTVSEWVKQLQDKEPKARAEAGRALGIIGQPAKAAIPDLVKALKDEESLVRDWACYGLSCMGPEAKEAIPELEKVLLNDRVVSVRYMAANALGSMRAEGKPGVAALCKTLRDDDPWLRHFSAVNLGSIGPAAKDAVPNLVAAFKDSEYVVRKAAVLALGEMGPAAKDAVPSLIDKWRDTADYSAVSDAAARSLKKIDPEVARNAGVP